MALKPLTAGLESIISDLNKLHGGTSGIIAVTVALPFKIFSEETQVSHDTVASSGICAKYGPESTFKKATKVGIKRIYGAEDNF